MIAERGGLLRHIAVNIQHPAVIMAEHSQPVAAHCRGHVRRLHPVPDFLPGGRILEVTGDQMISDTRTIEDTGNFRRVARLAMFQPDAGHQAAISQRIEFRVIQLRHRLQIQHDDRNACLLHNRQHGGTQRVSGDVEKNQIHLFASKKRGGFTSFRWIVHQARVGQVRSILPELAGNLALVTGQPAQQAGKLRPVSVKTDAEQSDANRIFFHKSMIGRDGKIPRVRHMRAHSPVA